MGSEMCIRDRISDKLVRRHPHVFGDKKADSAFHAKQNWEAAKQQEKKRESRLEGVPVTLPALVQAQRLQQKAAYVGFDWDATDKVWDKVHEEMEELKEVESSNNDSIQPEISNSTVVESQQASPPLELFIPTLQPTPVPYVMVSPVATSNILTSTV